MTCNINIIDVFGNGEPLNSITVVGNVQDCPPDIDGSNLEIELSCRSANDEGSIKLIADINSVGNWEATFQAPFSMCTCNGQVFVKARCLSVEGCEAEPFNDIIKCDDCPSLNFDEGDDITSTTVLVECDVDGSVLVKIKFKFFNDSGLFTQARVNCGPGGTPVSMDSPFVGPLGPNSTNELVSAICRYDPAITPVPAPFVEFVNLPDIVRSCPPVAIPVPPLPNCENAVCPSSAVIEIKGSDGNVVIVDGPNAVLCLLPGLYTATVVSPLPQPSIQYFWSQDGTLTMPLITEQSITIDLGEGESPTLSVAIVLQDCPPLTGSATLTGCVIDCDVDLTFVLRDDQNNVVDINQPCIPPGDYTLHAEGPVEPPWDFQWKVNGTISVTNTTSQFPVPITSDESVSIEVIASAPRCDDKAQVVTFIGCEKKTTDDDDKPGCATLLNAAIGSLIAGAILIIIGVCTGNPWVLWGGVALTAAGIVLLGIWLWLCSKSTACDVLQKARCRLIYAGWLFLLVTFALALLSGIACGVPAILSSIGWFALSSLITDLMAAKGCEIKSCTF